MKLIIKLLERVAPKTAVKYFGNKDTDYAERIGNYIPTLIDLFHDDINTRRGIGFIGNNSDPLIQSCISSLQLTVQNSTLFPTLYIHSWDVRRGLPTDIVCWNLVTQAIVHALGVEHGPTTYHAVSFHVYVHEMGFANDILKMQTNALY